MEKLFYFVLITAIFVSQWGVVHSVTCYTCLGCNDEFESPGVRSESGCVACTKSKSWGTYGKHTIIRACSRSSYAEGCTDDIGAGMLCYCTRDHCNVAGKHAAKWTLVSFGLFLPFVLKLTLGTM
ncbi:hypothetical protein MAR_030583 [Mya arenaria]|uniref:Uncharacterized protein n=1 Tax=Mya arenaria TaxID=6604 RepID=A0ABY7F3M8_MYAAR|nr:uncharacterized protein LOC128205343 [Mya arenaria]WAR15989.1 hypothetical protein MAR_030583 [Mya arenaria]